MNRRRVLATATVLCAMLVPVSTGYYVPGALAQDNSRPFQETGHTVKGRFLAYWDKNGGLPQQGYPLTEEIQERSDTEGKVYTVQYFERAVFEYHPENKAPYDVLLSLLGVFEYGKRYGSVGALKQSASIDNAIVFKETEKSLGGKFRAYWEAHGGLPQQGYPISNEFQERSALDGKVYTAQYFQRGVFELHPENAGSPYEVLLSQLGTFRFRNKYIYPEPAIPVQSGRDRGGIKGSERYLLWSEYNLTPDGVPVRGPSDLLALDVQTNQILRVLKDQAVDQAPAIGSGQIIAWADNRHTDGTGEFDVWGKELPDGPTFKIATGPADQLMPVVLDKTVVWLEFDREGFRLMSKNLATGATTVITSIKPVTPNPSLLSPQISDEYIVWSEVVYNSRVSPEGPSYIKAYNRKTGEIKVIVEYRASVYDRVRTEYALADHRIMITGEHPSLVDLNTMESSSLNWESGRAHSPMESPSLQGDIAIWSSRTEGVRPSNTPDVDVWGMNLKDGKAVPLVIGKGSQYATIAGDKLAWLNDQGPYDGGIGIMPLAAAFATAPERQRALDQQSSDPLYLASDLYIYAIQMVSPQEGWAGGEQGLILHYKGGKWQRVNAPTRIVSLRDISMISPEEGWAVSDEGTILHYTRGTWLVDVTIVGNKRLWGIKMLSANDGWIVGDNTILHYVDGRWQQVSSPLARNLRDIDMVSSQEGWIVGDAGALLHYKAGVWEQAQSPTGATLASVDMVSPDEGWAVGNRGTILHFSGGQWTTVTNPAASDLRSVKMVSAGEGWAVGVLNTLLHYTGGRWQLVDSPTRDYLISSVDMNSANEGWAVGSGGTILSYQGGRWSIYGR